MALFEVFIPTTDPNGFNITARIKADSWIQALRNGLARLGDTADVRNIMCDIREDGIHVTEPNSGRVFRIKELTGEVAAPEPAKPALPQASQTAAATTTPAAVAPKPVVSGLPPPAQKKPIAAAPAPATKVTLPAAPVSTVTEVPSVASPVRFSSNAQEESVIKEKPVAGAPTIGRAKETSGKTIEDLIDELFLATQNIYDAKDLRSASDFILDLAIKSIPSDSGAVFISDINRHDLYFSAARGPKAKEVMGFRVPMGQGIVGFCAQEGVSLGVSDVHRDPRFYAAISKSLGYETRSILCAPVQHQGRVMGAIELINKTEGTSFSGAEVNALNYLAHQFADFMVRTGQTGSL